MSVRNLLSGFAFCVIVLAGCSRQDDVHAEYTIALDVDELLEDEVSIFDIFSDVDLICLDNTHPTSNFVNVGTSNIASDGEHIFILDWRDLSVHSYEMDGTLAVYSDKRGRGPGEYVAANQIAYNEELDKVEILCPMCRIFRYSPDSLKFDSVIDFSGQELLAAHNFWRSGDDYTLLVRSEKDKLWNLDPGSLELSSYGYRPPEHLDHYISAQMPFFEFAGKPCFFRTYDGLVYTFDVGGRRLVPYIEWDLGKYQCLLEDIPEDEAALEGFDFVLENSRKRFSPFIEIKAYGSRIFAGVVHNGEIHTICHDLETGESLLFEKTVEGMSFLPELFRDGVMYKFVDYTFLPEYVNREILDASSQAAYDKVLAEEGAAIVRYRLK